MCATCRNAELAGEAFALRAALADQEARAARLEGLLRETQFMGGGDQVNCPLCYAVDYEGHDANCRIAAALAVPAAGREGDGEVSSPARIVFKGRGQPAAFAGENG